VVMNRRHGSFLVLCLMASLNVANPAAQSTNSDVVTLAAPVFQADGSHHTPAQQRRASRDSLGNGAIVGALIGAAAFGAFGAVLCHSFQEEDGPSCVPDTFRFAAIGGAIGTGAGLAIDAARSRRGVTVRFVISF
jgi:hypothetical protein